MAPLSTLSNWVNEFKKWCPSIPVCLFHGTKDDRKELLKGMRKHLDKSGRPTEKFPIICTSYEMVLREATDLRKFNWGFVIIVRSNLQFLLPYRLTQLRTKATA